MPTPIETARAKIQDSPEVNKAFDNIVSQVPGHARAINSLFYQFVTARDQLLNDVVDFYICIMARMSRAMNATSLVQSNAAGSVMTTSAMAEEMHASGIWMEYGYAPSTREIFQSSTFRDEIWIPGKLRILSSLFGESEFSARMTQRLAVFSQGLASGGAGSSLTTRTGSEISGGPEYTRIDGDKTIADHEVAASLDPENPHGLSRVSNLMQPILDSGFSDANSVIDEYGRDTTQTTRYGGPYIYFEGYGAPIPHLLPIDDKTATSFKRKRYDPAIDCGEYPEGCWSIFTELELVTLEGGRSNTDPTAYNTVWASIEQRNHGQHHQTYTTSGKPHTDPLFYQLTMNYEWNKIGGMVLGADVDNPGYTRRLQDSLGGGYGLGTRAQQGGKVTADDLDRLAEKDIQSDLVTAVAEQARETDYDGSSLKSSTKIIEQRAGTTNRSQFALKDSALGFGYDRDAEILDTVISYTADYGGRWKSDFADDAVSYTTGDTAEFTEQAIIADSRSAASGLNRTLGGARLMTEETHRGNLIKWASAGARQWDSGEFGQTLKNDIYLNKSRRAVIRESFEKLVENSAATVSAIEGSFAHSAFMGEGATSRSFDNTSILDEKCSTDTSYNSWDEGKSYSGNAEATWRAANDALLACKADPACRPNSRRAGDKNTAKKFYACTIAEKDTEYPSSDVNYAVLEGQGAIVTYGLWWDPARRYWVTQLVKFENKNVEIKKKVTSKAFPNWVKQCVELHQDSILDGLSDLEEILVSLYENSDAIRKLFQAFDEPIEQIMADIEFPSGDSLADRVAQNLMTMDAFFGTDFYDGEAAKEELNREQRAADPATISGIDWAKRAIYKEQCFLLSFINDIAKAKAEGFENPTLAAARAINPQYGKATAKRLPYYVRKNGTDKKDLSNACLQVRGDPYGFINALTQAPTQAVLFEMTTDKISQLQPQIRLYKIEYDKDESGSDIRGAEREVEISFDSYAKGLSAALQTTKRRGEGVGIKSFSFTYDGNNPFAAKKSIKAQLQIFANSFDELLETRGTSRPYRYVDLALKTSGGDDASNRFLQCKRGPQEENDELAKLNFRLKAVVGWAPPINYPAGYTEAEKHAVDNSYVTLELTPTVHDFGLDEMGRVTLTINYLAYVEDFFDQPTYNIFADLDMLKNQKIRMMETKVLSKKCSGEEIGNIKDSYADDILQDKKDSISSLMRSLMSARKVRYINLSYEKVQSFIQKGPWAHYEEFPEGITGLVQDSITNQAQLQQQIDGALATLETAGSIPDDETKGNVSAALAVTNPDVENLSFFYLSDLIDVALGDIEAAFSEMPDTIGGIKLGDFKLKTYDSDDQSMLMCLKQNEALKLKTYAAQYKKLRILLGPLEITHPTNPELNNFISLGDLPVAVKYFVEWLTDRLSKKEETIYPVARFCNELINTLIRNFMNDDSCFHVSVKQKIRLNQNVITAYPTRFKGSKSQLDSFTQFMASKGDTATYAASSVHTNQLQRRPFLNIAGPPKRSSGTTSEGINYIVFFAGRTQPIERQTGDRKYDMKHGIFHYMIGKPRGIVKTIDLSKTDSKGLAEVRFEQDGYDGLRQLRVTYDASIKTYANVQTFPGTYLFIEPRGFAPNMLAYGRGDYDLTQYGIGGYYMIIRSTHTFGPGLADSQIEAKWVSQLESESEAEEAEKRKEGASQDDLSKCGALRAKRKEQAATDMQVPESPGLWDMTAQWFDSTFE